LPPAQYDELNLPSWLRRSKYAPLQEEIDAVEVSKAKGGEGS
jgi:hypothetical protein